MRSKLLTDRRSAAAARSTAASTDGGMRVVTDSKQNSSERIGRLAFLAVNVGNGGFAVTAPTAGDGLHRLAWVLPTAAHANTVSVQGGRSHAETTRDGIAAAMVLLGQQGDALTQLEMDAAQAERGLRAGFSPSSAYFAMPGCRKFLAFDLTNADSYYGETVGGCVYRVSTIFHFGTRLGVCAPEEANPQTIRVVVTYIDQRPARMREPFEDLALEALQQAWPCRR